MSSDRIQLLEKKIHEAVEYIVSLREENRTLHNKIKEKEEALHTLEERLAAIQSEHGSIEKGVESALKSLELLEDEISHPGKKSDSPQKELNAFTAATDPLAAKDLASDPILETPDADPEPEAPDFISSSPDDPLHTVDFFTSPDISEEESLFPTNTPPETKELDADSS